MKDIKQIKSAILIIGVASFSMMSCTADYLDINSNPYEVTKDQMKADGYGLGAAMSGMAGVVISTATNTAQFTECLMGGTQGGYFGDTGSWEYTISQFNATDDWTNVLLNSKEIIPLFYSNYTELKRVTDDPVALAIGDVMKVAAMHRVTDTYGPIPYSKIGADGQIKVPYDSQEQVYRQMFNELTAASAVLTQYRTSTIPATADYVFGGNVEKWAKFANSLKLRLAMRVSVAAPELARQMAEEAVNSEVGVMTANADNAFMSALGEQGNPMYQAIWYNAVQADKHGGSACKTGGETHASADITSYMNAYADPRRAKYFIPSEWEGQQYCGIRRGIVRPSLEEKGHKYSGVAIDTQDPIMWMNAAEVAFLKAEGAVRGYNMGETAENLYNEGIRLSFEQYGADGYAAYIEQSASVNVGYTDPAGDNNYSGASLTTLPVKWNEADGFEEKIERVIIQKWIANWKLGNEAWADYRRTGYPHLFPATESGNRSNGVVDSDKGARRMPYPMAEYTTNNENLQNALNMLAGPDNMGTDVWFAIKNN